MQPGRGQDKRQRAVLLLASHLGQWQAVHALALVLRVVGKLLLVDRRFSCPVGTGQLRHRPAPAPALAPALALRWTL